MAQDYLKITLAYDCGLQNHPLNFPSKRVRVHGDTTFSTLGEMVGSESVREHCWIRDAITKRPWVFEEKPLVRQGLRYLIQPEERVWSQLEGMRDEIILTRGTLHL